MYFYSNELNKNFIRIDVYNYFINFDLMILGLLPPDKDVLTAFFYCVIMFTSVSFITQHSWKTVLG